jgi:hypothetical protein
MTGCRWRCASAPPPVVDALASVYYMVKVMLALFVGCSAERDSLEEVK